jgi:HEAT repeat protein
MANSVNQLLNLQGSEREILHKFIELIGSVLVEDSLLTSQLVILLQKPGRTSLQCDNYDLDKVNFVRNQIINMLMDDQSVEILINKLDEYRTRYVVATMLGWFRSKAKIALPKLIGIVGDSGLANGAAKRSILLIGVDKKYIFEEMQNSIYTGDDGVFRELCDLVVIASYRTFPAFVDLLRSGSISDNSNIREVVADYIGRLAPSEKIQLLPVLEKLKCDPEKYVREAAEISANEAC